MSDYLLYSLKLSDKEIKMIEFALNKIWLAPGEGVLIKSITEKINEIKKGMK